MFVGVGLNLFFLTGETLIFPAFDGGEEESLFAEGFFSTFFLITRALVGGVIFFLVDFADGWLAMIFFADFLAGEVGFFVIGFFATTRPEEDFFAEPATVLDFLAEVLTTILEAALGKVLAGFFALILLTEGRDLPMVLATFGRAVLPLRTAGAFFGRAEGFLVFGRAEGFLVFGRAEGFLEEVAMSTPVQKRVDYRQKFDFCKLPFHQNRSKE